VGEGAVRKAVCTSEGTAVDAPREIQAKVLPQQEYGIGPAAGQILERFWGLNEGTVLGSSCSAHSRRCYSLLLMDEDLLAGWIVPTIQPIQRPSLLHEGDDTP